MNRRSHFLATPPIVLGVAMLLSALAVAGDVDTELGASMDRMASTMATVTMTGNADQDFARMMIPHHRGAIDMAKAELVYGHDVRLRRLAQEIVVTQGSEIDVMRAALRNGQNAK